MNKHVSSPRPAAAYGQFVKFSSLSDGTLRLVVDVPHERANAVLDVLGFPAGQDIALVLLSDDVPRSSSPTAEESRPSPKTPDSEAARPRTPWHELSRTKQAAIRCSDEKFAEYLRLILRRRAPRAGPATHIRLSTPEDVAAAVRQCCAVRSRAEFNSTPEAAARWDQLDAEYREWAGLETEPRG